MVRRIDFMSGGSARSKRGFTCVIIHRRMGFSARQSTTVQCRIIGFLSPGLVTHVTQLIKRNLFGGIRRGTAGWMTLVTCPGNGWAHWRQVPPFLADYRRTKT
jgi:hypothetical protein